MIRPPVRVRKSCTSSRVLSSVRLPGTTLTTRRCSGSKATWSQLSPCWRSSGFSGRQCFSFLVTKDHFSSNCTSRVLGGKSHNFVVDILGVFPGDHREAYHRVLVDAHQAAGLPHPATLLEVLQDRQSLVRGELATVQGGPLAFTKAVLAGAAGQDTAVLVGSVAKAHTQMVEAALAVVGALLVLTAEVFQVVHEASHHLKPSKKVV